MNESEKILRLLNQHWDYSNNNNSFASKITRLYFGRGSDFIYIRDGRPRYREILEKLFKRNESKVNFFGVVNYLFPVIFQMNYPTCIIYFIL
jgi:hypothetical protein